MLLLVEYDFFSKVTICNSAQILSEVGGNRRVHGEHQFAAGDCSAEQRRRNQLMSPVNSHNCGLLLHVSTFESKLYFYFVKPMHIWNTNKVLSQSSFKVAQSDIYWSKHTLSHMESNFAPPVLLKEAEGGHYSAHFWKIKKKKKKKNLMWFLQNPLLFWRFLHF